MPTVLVTGANRGLGLEFATQYAADGWTVIATARDPGEANALRSVAGTVEIQALDVADFAAIGGLAARLRGRPLDLLLSNAGIWQPEHVETAADAEAWLDAFRVNSMAPVLLAQALLGNVAAAAEGKLVAVTSRMGSIADNSSGGYIAYRSSKAALNAAWKSLALEVAAQGVIAAVLHPGWVQTRMGGAGAKLTPSESVTGMRRVIAGLGTQQSGGFFNYDGTALPW